MDDSRPYRVPESFLVTALRCLGLGALDNRNEMAPPTAESKAETEISDRRELVFLTGKFQVQLLDILIITTESLKETDDNRGDRLRCLTYLGLSPGSQVST